MPSSQNASLSLRQSIAGSNSPLTSSPTDLYLPDELDDQDLQDGPRGPIPPILVVPPGMTLEKFCGEIEVAHGILDIAIRFENDYENEDARIEHSIELMDEGISFAMVGDYRSASDILSLCTLLYPNYFYNYLLAVTRFELDDFAGTLQLLETALTYIRDKQVLTEELADFSKAIDFTDGFYTLYIPTLLYNGKSKQAQEIVDFVLDRKVLNLVPSFFEIMSYFQVLGNKSKLADLSEAVLPLIENIPDVATRDSLLTSLRDFIINPLTGKPFSTEKSN